MTRNAADRLGRPGLWDRDIGGCPQGTSGGHWRSSPRPRGVRPNGTEPKASQAEGMQLRPLSAGVGREGCCGGCPVGSRGCGESRVGVGRWLYLGYFRVRSFNRWKTRGQLQGLAEVLPFAGGAWRWEWACRQVETDMSAWYILLLRCPLDRCARRTSARTMDVDLQARETLGLGPLPRGCKSGRGQAGAQAALVTETSGEEEGGGHPHPPTALEWGRVTMAWTRAFP